MSGRFTLEAVFGANDQLSRVIGKISNGFTRMAASAKGPWGEFSKLNDKFVSKLEGMGKKTLKLGLGLTGIAGAFGFHEMITGGEETEAALARLGSVTLRTVDQIAELADKAKEMGGRGKFTAAEIAGAMEMLQHAGLADAQVIQSIDNVARAAKIGSEEVAITAKEIVTAAKAMGTSGDEMGAVTAHIADLVSFAAASKFTTASVSELTEGLVAVGPVAKQLKIPLEEVMAANIGLKESGIDAADGISKLFIKLSKPPPKLAYELQQWKIKFKDAQGNMLPFATVMDNVSKAAKKSGGSFNQVAFLAELVGAKSEKAAIALTEMFDSGRYGELTQSLKDANSQVKKIGELRGDTIRGDITQITARIREMSDSIFDLARGPLRELTSETLHWIDANKDTIKTKVVEYIHDFAEALPKIADRVERLWPLVKIIGEISAAIWTVNKATAAWTALSAMNPWVLGLTAVLAAATLLVEFWPEIKQFFKDHQIAIGAVGIALSALGIAIYGPQGLNIAIDAVSKSIGGVRVAAIASKDALLALNEVSFTGALAAIGAVALAAGAVVALIDQIQKFDQENKAGLWGTAQNMVTYGTWNPFEANSEAQDDEARREAANRPQVITPHAHGSTDWANGVTNTTETNNLSEVVITDETGRAKWKTPPKSGAGVRLRPSGSL